MYNRPERQSNVKKSLQFAIYLYYMAMYYVGIDSLAVMHVIDDRK